MFRSSENLRLAAEMRALERVAGPWREARRSWFDGTPESVEARLAATERVLTFAKAGVTEAHIALEREAAAARAELKEASHRLLVDFLDDGARAFKGSKRVAGAHDKQHRLAPPYKNRIDRDLDGVPLTDHPHELIPSGEQMGMPRCQHCHDDIWLNRETNQWQSNDGGWPSYRDVGPHVHSPSYGGGVVVDDDGYVTAPQSDDGKHRAFEGSHRAAKERGLRECINCGGSLSGEEGDDPEAECLTCGMSAHEKGVDWNKKGSYRSAGSQADLGGGSDIMSMGPTENIAGSVSLTIPDALKEMALNGSTMTGQEETPAFNPGPRAARRRY